MTARNLRRLVCGLTAILAVAAGRPMQAGGAQNPREMLDRAMADFQAARIPESVAGFDRLATLQPESAPYLWQRGIALYYAGRYQDCAAQFVSHRTVNPNDVENAAWHFLCVARAETPQAAVAKILPVGPDQRAPMREIYQMFLGRATDVQVIAAAGRNPGAQFYAHLYVGLYREALGDRPAARTHITAAADARYAEFGGYMHDVARVHLIAISK